MDYTILTDRAVGGFIQGLVVSFIITVVFLPASYIMNRFIYRGTAMRIFLGILAGLSSIVGFVILFILRFFVYGNTFKTHYFGLLPVTTNESSDFILKTIIDPFVFNFKDDADTVGYARTVENLLANFTPNNMVNDVIETIDISGARSNILRNTVFEPFFETGRALSKLSAEDLKTWGEVAAESYSGNKRELNELQGDITRYKDIGRQLFM
jgi:hypothetical protein